jgi:hypothetical protein
MQTTIKDGHLITIFGDWSEPEHLELDADGKLLVKWLNSEWLGDDDTSDLLAVIRKEFIAQEKYRNTINSQLTALQHELMLCGAEVRANIDLPDFNDKTKGPGSIYALGLLEGRYAALMVAAQRIQDVIDKAALEVAQCKS